MLHGNIQISMPAGLFAQQGIHSPTPIDLENDLVLLEQINKLKHIFQIHLRLIGGHGADSFYGLFFF
jgi:hypothetical protein